jgi:hypothetical protein
MKIMIKPIAICSLIFFSLISCRKDTEVSGIVYDYYTNKPAKNVKVQLFFKKGGSFGGSNSDLESTFTNNDGSFSLIQKSGKVSGLKAWSHHGGRGALAPVIPITTNKINSGVSIAVEQDAQYLIKIHNVNPFDNNDKFKFTSYYTSSIPYNTIFGMNVNTNFYEQAYGNTTNYFEYFITKNGLMTSFRDSIFVSTDSISVLEINY